MRRILLLLPLITALCLPLMVMDGHARARPMNAKDFTDLCTQGTPSEVKAAIAGGADVNAYAKKEVENREVTSTALMAASAWSNLDVINILIKAGAKVNARDNEDKTALFMAAGNTDNPEVINTLIKAGAEVNARDQFGWTALIEAAARVNNTNPEVINALIKAGADVNARDNNGETVLMYAMRSNNTVAKDALVRAGARK